MNYTSNSYEETQKIASEFAKKLKPGDILTLDGDLGAGKTAFTGGLAKGIGINGYVTSPTFTIVNEYRNGTMPLFHFDVYRLESMDDLYDIGWEDYTSQGGICVVEWADIIRDGLDLPYYEIRITKLSDDKRNITINHKGE
ncbi:MAG: tRNA (adenosine(37)-N6)-threonylcarbamoyltransferase complex ATPase subunit type 1 TsaE [Clostridia bacterium]|nr:tRNA (adenosine(37)-N6)-threonylcarbamoyltransferase complex ATPase subunit type 1 TsaE [Clostridia bacterium]